MFNPKDMDYDNSESMEYTQLKSSVRHREYEHKLR